MKAGTRLVQADYGEALTLIAQKGEGGAAWRPAGRPAGRVHAEGAAASSRRKDLTDYRVVERAPIRGRYRDWQIVGPPPPAASGVHITQMLNILEGYDIKSLGFGTVDTLHLLAEVLKIAFADRAQASGDPAFVDVPVERITSKAYADQRRADIDLGRARRWTSGLLAKEGADTTHLTAADGKGNVVATTQTINSLFGARFVVPGIGMVPNDYMSNFDPRPGSALSIAPGKRVTTSMAPIMALRDGRLIYALGLPGGRKIFPSALAGADQPFRPRHDPAGGGRGAAHLDRGAGARGRARHPREVRQGLSERGHKLQVMPTVAGGMNAIQFHDDGSMTGAACWRADGSPLRWAVGWRDLVCASSCRPDECAGHGSHVDRMLREG